MNIYRAQNLTVPNSQKKSNKRQHQGEKVKRKRGETVKDKNARLERWAEHFQEVLVREPLMK